MGVVAGGRKIVGGAPLSDTSSEVAALTNTDRLLNALAVASAANNERYSNSGAPNGVLHSSHSGSATRLASGGLAAGSRAAGGGGGSDVGASSSHTSEHDLRQPVRDARAIIIPFYLLISELSIT